MGNPRSLAECSGPPRSGPQDILDNPGRGTTKPIPSGYLAFEATSDHGLAYNLTFEVTRWATKGHTYCTGDSATMEKDHWVWLTGSRKRSQLFHVHLVDDKVASDGSTVDILTTNVEDVATVEGFIRVTLRTNSIGAKTGRLRICKT